YHNLVTKNIILINRLKDVGVLPAEMCRKYGATGPVLRGSGVDYDVRKNEPYSVYPELDFEVPVYAEGDSMARYMVRMDEIDQCLRIVEQALDKLPEGPVMAEKVPKILKPAAGDYYGAVEAARGTFGIRIVSDGTNTPYRMKLRSPTFSNLSLYGEASRGLLLPDALALMGSLDLVIPEIDR
ncbi:MAG: NADH-quinone oxidoreductase subunit D, partial [Desulfobulbaceae bacterium]|nr:NADH-quinone oxidoreductase subunit D [Desulfobulbaceae bacterium]